MDSCAKKDTGRGSGRKRKGEGKREHAYEIGKEMWQWERGAVGAGRKRGDRKALRAWMKLSNNNKSIHSYLCISNIKFNRINTSLSEYRNGEGHNKERKSERKINTQEGKYQLS